ncbi:OmpH family outer membrane protein [bacterium SCSIO 12741]|nr:OmpH family outer membrane protein [bacterium SCSIO 12741]
MKPKNLTLSVLAILALSFAIFSFTTKPGPKIAYVRTQELMNQYHGMIEAREIYKNQDEAWKVEMEQAYRTFRTKAQQVDAAPGSLEEAQLKNEYEQLRTREQEYKEKSQKLDDQLTQRVLDQVNGFIEEYAEDHSYQMVLGTTQAGNLLYGEEQLDITKDLINQLNQHYDQK